MGEFYFLDEVLGEWHEHENNYSGKIIKHVNAYIKVKEFHFKLYGKSSFRPKIILGKSNMFFTASRMLQKSGEFVLALKFILRAIFKFPFYWKSWIVLILCILKISK